jgi:hypothetical protein
MLTSYDKVLILVLIAVIAFGFLFLRSRAQEEVLRVIIEAEGKVVKDIALNKLNPGTDFSVEGPLGYSILEVGQDRVRLRESPCPDHICLHMGWISQAGEIIVCLPNKVIIRIEGRPVWDGISQ